MLDFKNAVSMTVAAQVLEPTEADMKDLDELVKAYHIAAAPGPIENGRPRMLFINGWIAHEGRNLNGDAFIKEELERRVEQGLFSPPFAGMIDDDHDFTARGFWYKTSFAFDKAANKWGIFAQGAIWAWRYAELADRLLAEMHRNGKIMVSMSTIPESREFTSNFTGAEGQQTCVLHNPVFFTTSTLSVPAGDDQARAVATEVVAEGVIDPSNEHPEKTVSHEVNMDKVKTAAELAADEEQKNKDAADAAAEKAKAEAEAEAAKKAKDKEDMDKKKLDEEKDASLAELKTKLAEAEIAIKSLTDTKTALETELAAVKAKLDAFEAEKAEKELSAKWDARLAEVPEVIKTNLEKHAEKDAVLAKWKNLTNPEWELICASFKLISTDVSFTERSDGEGKLPLGGGSPTDTKTGLSAYLKD